ncbi:MAG: FAD:protein FMN transferase [Rudaea sp.]
MRAFRFDFPSMGCPCSLQLEAADEASAASAAARARAEVARLDEKYSHYRDDNWLARICAGARGDHGIEVDDETANLLDFADALHAQSAARFDITAGPLTRLWDLQRGRLPTHEEIDDARARVGWSRVSWVRPRLRLPLPGTRLDLGGIVKEYAADRAAQCCRDSGVMHGIVDLGGDLAVIGAHADGKPWLAGIKAPRDPRQPCATIEIAGGGLATSGDYERALVVGGRRYSHIIDPRSGWPVEGFASVSVIAASCLVAGAAATLAMLLGIDEGGAYLRELGLPFLCVDQAGRPSGSIETLA